MLESRAFMKTVIDYREYLCSGQLQRLPYPTLVALLQLPRAQSPRYYREVRQRAQKTLLNQYSTPNLEQNPLNKGAVLSMVGLFCV